MKVLVLGGTRYISRHIVEALVSARHHVSVFTRGTSPDELPPDVERLRGSRMHVSHERASAARLTLTDPRTTITDTRAWLRDVQVSPALTPDRELIATSRGGSR